MKIEKLTYLHSAPEIPSSSPNTKHIDPELRSALPFEVVIMAGGKGERLLPLTKDRPKPLVEIGGKPIVEYMIDRLSQMGIKYYTFCLNYLGEKVEAYFGDGSDRGIHIDYIYEQEALGTIGGAALKKEYRFQDLLIVNGDLLTTINFEKFFSFFLEGDADISVATIPYRMSLPYGIMETDENREIQTIREKPTYTYYINTGMYFMKRSVLELVPEGEASDAISLIEKAMEMGLKVTSYPVLNYWIDIGQMADYKKAQEDVEFLDW